MIDNLVRCAANALRLDAAVKDIIPYCISMLDRVNQDRNSISSIFTLITFISRYSGAWPHNVARARTGLV
jgi:hypothetical protein